MIRPPHGRAAEHGTPGPRIEQAPLHALPAAVGAPPPNGGREGAKHGVLAQAVQVSLAPECKPYRDAADELTLAIAEEHCALAGGELGPTALSFLRNAALVESAGRYLLDQAASLASSGDVDALGEMADISAKGSRMLDAAKQYRLASWEVAMRAGSARAKDGGGRSSGPVDAAELARRAEEKARARRAGKPIDVSGESSGEG